jgi:hypothetical protein
MKNAGLELYIRIDKGLRKLIQFEANWLLRIELISLLAKPGATAPRDISAD